MEFRYQYKTEVSDLWQLSMYYAYSSFLAVINVVCTVSAFALIVSCWEDAGVLFRCGMVLFASLFTVIQPVTIWFKSKRQLGTKQPEMELVFDRSGLTITADGKQVHKKWGQVKRVVEKPTLVVVYMDDAHGYILPNRILGDTRKKFVGFVKQNIKG